MKQRIPYEFGIKRVWHSAYDTNPTHIKRLKKLSALKDAPLIREVCKHYISNFIPHPVQNEGIYWIMSCFPSTDNSPVRISIWFPEVFNIHASGSFYGYTEDIRCMIFLHKDFLNEEIKSELVQQNEGLTFQPFYRFRTGIAQQLCVFIPLKSYFAFVENETVYESIRTHNYELSQKGRTPFKRGHNYEFVRSIFGE